MVEGCTIGAKVISNHFFLFKNKDLRYNDFKDQAIFDDNIFAVTGVNIGTGELSGVSIGINRWGLAACSANVLATNDQSYDLLLDKILRNSRSINDAYRTILDSFRNRESYQWCNIVVATLDRLAVFEIGPGIVDKEEHTEQVVRTNHHIMLSTKVSLSELNREKELENRILLSEKRRQQASKLIENVSTLENVIGLLSHHSETKGYDSICRHRLTGDRYVGETVYSYILEVGKQNKGDLVFQMHVARSNPCSNPYERILIDYNASTDERKRVVEDFP
jgi:hypothetical protein